MPTEDETREALTDALRTHVAVAGEGAFMTDFIIIAAAAMPESADTTRYITESSDGPIHHRLGLVRYLTLRADTSIAEDD